MLWRRCPGHAARRSPNASRRVPCKGIGGASRPSKGLLDGRRGSGAGGGHHAGPEPERDGVCAWTRRSVPLAGASPRPTTPRATRAADGIFPPEGAPEPPAKGRRSAGALQKRGLRDILKATAAAHPDKRLQLWFQDEARVGNKGRVCHRWCAPGTRQIGYQWAYMRPEDRHPGDAERQRPWTCFSHTSPWTRAHHDVPLWHDERALTVPDNVTLALCRLTVPSTPERVWLYLRERFLSLRVLGHRGHHRRLLAWIDLIAEPDRMRTLCAYPWIMKVIS